MIYYTINKNNIIDSISADYNKLHNKFPSEQIYVSNKIDSIYIKDETLVPYGS